jgi:C4-dicarboxylate-specific signal transduction histidine kinase
MLRAKPMDLDAIYEIQQDIVADIVRAGQVIERVRSLLRRGEMDHQPLELNDVTESVLALTRSDLGRRGVSLDVHLAPGLAPVKGDRVQMQQVLLNLLVNASEAMADVATEQRRLMVATRDGPRPYEVELMVADHGPGIAAERLEHIFEPFYTTKASGLGLGLAVCRSIMQAHGGRLWAANSAHGAVFHVTFPKQV